MANNLKATLEALIFIYGEPIKIKKLAQLTESGEDAVEKTLEEIRSGLESEDRGLQLMIDDGEVSFVTKPELGTLIQSVIKEEIDSELTPASLETLAIISYLGPCSRAEIDYIRGVNSAVILRSLAIRGLITKKPDPAKGTNYLYQVSGELLRYIGLTASKELPEYEKYHALIKKLRENNEAPEVK